MAGAPITLTSGAAHDEGPAAAVPPRGGRGQGLPRHPAPARPPHPGVCPGLIKTKVIN